MRITYSPQYNPDASIFYSFAGETITATIGEQSDAFDLSALPEGGGVEEVTTTLPALPVISATRTGGMVEVLLLRWYGDEDNPATWPINEEV